MYPSLNGSNIGSIGNEDENDHTATADGTLVVMVIRAKHLPNRRKLDKQSPYVVARIGTVAKKTLAAFRAGQTPEWTHEMRFELSRERKPILKIDVLDETKNDPTPIGNVEIDASIIFTNPENNENGKYIYDKWYDLTLNGRRAGMIYLEMTFYPTAPVLPPKIPIDHPEEMVVVNERDQYDTVSAMGQSMRSMNSSKYKDLPSPPLNQQQQQSYLSKLEGNHSVADDVFVNLENSNTSKTSSIFLKKFSKYSGGVTSTNSTNIDREVFVSSELDKNQDNNSKKGAKKYTSKLAKLTDKFQSKQPISTLWKNNESMSDNTNIDAHQSSTTTTGTGTTNAAPKVFSSFNTRRSVSPLSDYGSNDLDQLQRDLSHTQISDGHGSEHYNNREDNQIDNSLYKPLPEIEFNSPPVPPPHLIVSNTEDNYYKSNDNINASSSTSPRRKPPPQLLSSSSSPKANNAKKSPSTNGFSPTFDLTKSTAIPFSADTIGIDDDDDEGVDSLKNRKDILPTQVYLLDQPVKSLSFPSNTNDGLSSSININSDEIDPKYYAPTPSEHFNRSQRFNNNNITKDDLKIDFRTNQTGYLGNGNFSPSVFQRAVKHNWDDLSTTTNGDIDYNEFSGDSSASEKPEVPPKIPKGLTETEYYILEKEKYLRDLRGNRI